MGRYYSIMLIAMLIASHAFGQPSNSPNEISSEQKAIAELEKLGAKVIKSEANRKDEDREVSSVIIDEKWKGGDEGLNEIERLPKLSTLFIVGRPKISDERVTKLKKTLPKLSIQRRGNVQLGISSVTSFGPASGVLIGIVKEGSPAAKAGLMQGDLLTKFDGKLVADFEDLVNVILKKEPGDEVEVVVIRGEKSMTIKVKLEKWY
jgi:membrane-associated protease RseP (regulator of RpoE activity)